MQNSDLAAVSISSNFSSHFSLNSVCLFSEGTTAPIHVPGLPPEFMQNIMHQISQQAAAMATAASAGHQGQQQGTAGTGAQNADSPAPLPPQARVVITRPTLSPRIPQPMSTRGTTINLQETVPPSAGQQTNQV